MIRSPKRRRNFLACTLASGLLTLGCNHHAADKDVLANVNGYKIPRSEVDKTYNMQTAGMPQTLSLTEEQTLRLNILHQTIERELLLQRAAKLGIAATKDEVNAKVEQAKAPYTKEEFEKLLKDLGMNEADYRQGVRRNLTIAKLQEKEISSKVMIADSDIEAYYNQHKSQFNLTEPQYHIAHIFVSGGPGPQPAQTPDKAPSDAQAQAKIRLVYARLESGEDFAELAARYSDDRETASNGGALGATRESQLSATDAATRDAILKLKPGGYSRPIAVVDPQSHRQIGYRVVRLISKDAPGQRELTDPGVQQSIRTQLRSQREQLLKAAFEATLYDGADIHNYYAESIVNEAGKK